MFINSIVPYGGVDYGSLRAEFRGQLETAVGMLGSAANSTCVYLVKNYGALLPNANERVSFHYYNSKRFNMEEAPAVNAFVKEMKQIEMRWVEIGRYLPQESIKICVFFLWPDRETIEHTVFGAEASNGGGNMGGNGGGNN